MVQAVPQTHHKRLAEEQVALDFFGEKVLVPAELYMNMKANLYYDKKITTSSRTKTAMLTSIQREIGWERDRIRYALSAYRPQ